MAFKEPHYLTEQGYKNLIKLQVQYEKVVEQNRQLQTELREKTAECEELKNTLDVVKGIIQTIAETNRTYPLRNNLSKVLEIISRTKGR